jgi:hypothetical protein
MEKELFLERTEVLGGLLKNDKKFSIQLCSDLDYEGMVVDLCYDAEIIASINYDKGIDRMEVEFFRFGKADHEVKFPLKDFLETLDEAKKLALQCAEEDRQRDL